MELAKYFGIDSKTELVDPQNFENNYFSFYAYMYRLHNCLPTVTCKHEKLKKIRKNHSFSYSYEVGDIIPRYVL